MVDPAEIEARHTCEPNNHQAHYNEHSYCEDVSKGDGKHNRNAWHNDRPKIRFVRYADDWCVCLTRYNKRKGQRLRDEIRDFLLEDSMIHEPAWAISIDVPLRWLRHKRRTRIAAQAGHRGQFG